MMLADRYRVEAEADHAWLLQRAGIDVDAAPDAAPDLSIGPPTPPPAASASPILELAEAAEWVCEHHRMPPCEAVERTRAAIVRRADRVASAWLDALEHQMPGDPAVHQLRYAFAAATGDRVGCCQALSRWVDADPNAEPARRAWFRCAARVAPRRALADLRRWTWAPDTMRWLTVSLLIRLGRWAEARRNLELLLRSCEDVSVRRRLAGLCTSVGDARRATEHWTIVRRLRPSSAAAAIQQVRCLLQQGELARAGRAAFAAQRALGDDRLLGGLVLAAASSGRTQLVERVLESRTTRSRRRIWASAARLQDAATIGVLHDRSSSQTPHHAVVAPLEALLRSARRVWRSEARHHPSHADAQFHLAVCERRLGHPASAIRALQKSLQLNDRYGAARRLARHGLPGLRRAA